MLVKSWIHYAGGCGGGFAAADDDYDGYDCRRLRDDGVLKKLVFLRIKHVLWHMICDFIRIQDKLL
jgi:hypothetical protein